MELQLCSIICVNSLISIYHLISTEITFSCTTEDLKTIWIELLSNIGKICHLYCGIRKMVDKLLNQHYLMSWYLKNIIRNPSLYCYLILTMTVAHICVVLELTKHFNKRFLILLFLYQPSEVRRNHFPIL